MSTTNEKYWKQKLRLLQQFENKKKRFFLLFDAHLKHQLIKITIENRMICLFLLKKKNEAFELKIKSFTEMNVCVSFASIFRVKAMPCCHHIKLSVELNMIEIVRNLTIFEISTLNSYFLRTIFFALLFFGTNFTLKFIWHRPLCTLLNTQHGTWHDIDGKKIDLILYVKQKRENLSGKKRHKAEMKNAFVDRDINASVQSATIK